MDRRLLFLALGMFALGTDNFVVAGVLPEVARGFDISVGAAGQMTTIYALTFAVLAPVIAAVASGVNRKLLLLVGLGIFVLANLGTALAPSFGFAMAMRALAGLGAAIFSPTATSAATMIVPPERRGFALSVVVAGMTVSTALGSPTGAIIAGLGDWRWTMLFVAALAALSALGVLAFLSHIAKPAAITLRQRLAPLADARIGLALLTTLLFMSGAFTVYTYFSVVFDRVIGGNPTMLGGLLVLWGLAGTVSNLLAGRVIDAIGTRTLILSLLAVIVVDLVLLPWTSANLWTAIPAIVIWGAAGWGMLVPQQHRLVAIAPAIAPIVIGLSNSAAYLGLTAAGLTGALGIQLVGGHQLGYIATVLMVAATIAAELASRKMAAADKRDALAEAMRAVTP